MYARTSWLLSAVTRVGVTALTLGCMVILGMGSAQAKSSAGGNTCVGRILYVVQNVGGTLRWQAVGLACSGNCVQPAPTPVCRQYTYRQMADGTDVKVCACIAHQNGVPVAGSTPWLDLAGPQNPICDAHAGYAHDDDPFHQGTPGEFVLAKDCTVLPCPTGAGHCDDDGQLPAPLVEGDTYLLGCACKP